MAKKNSTDKIKQNAKAQRDKLQEVLEKQITAIRSQIDTLDDDATEADKEKLRANIAAVRAKGEEVRNAINADVKTKLQAAKKGRD